MENLDLERTTQLLLMTAPYHQAVIANRRAYHLALQAVPMEWTPTQFSDGVVMAITTPAARHWRIRHMEGNGMLPNGDLEHGRYERAQCSLCRLDTDLREIYISLAAAIQLIEDAAGAMPTDLDDDTDLQ